MKPCKEHKNLHLYVDKAKKIMGILQPMMHECSGMRGTRVEELVLEADLKVNKLGSSLHNLNSGKLSKLSDAHINKIVLIPWSASGDYCIAVYLGENKYRLISHCTASGEVTIMNDVRIDGYWVALMYASELKAKAELDSILNGD